MYFQHNSPVQIIKNKNWKMEEQLHIMETSLSFESSFQKQKWINELMCLWDQNFKGRMPIIKFCNDCYCKGSPMR